MNLRSHALPARQLAVVEDFDPREVLLRVFKTPFHTVDEDYPCSSGLVGKDCCEKSNRTGAPDSDDVAGVDPGVVDAVETRGEDVGEVERLFVGD